MSYFLQNFKLLPYKNLTPFILSIFFIVSCGDGNDENIAPIEVIMSASSEEVEYEEEDNYEDNFQDDYEDELEYVEVDNAKDQIKNKKQLYLENDYPDETASPSKEKFQTSEEENIDLKLKNKYKSNFASKRPIQRAKDTLDIEPLDDNNIVDDNKKSERIEIDDPW